MLMSGIEEDRFLAQANDGARAELRRQASHDLLGRVWPTPVLYILFGMAFVLVPPHREALTAGIGATLFLVCATWGGRLWFQLRSRGLLERDPSRWARRFFAVTL